MTTIEVHEASKEENKNDNNRPFIRNPLGRFKIIRCLTPKYSPVIFIEGIGACIGIWFLIFLTFSLFVGVVVPKSEVWSRIVASVLCFLALLSQLVSSCTDPGIILCSRVGDAKAESKEIEVPHLDKKVKCERCVTCNITRPMRSSHCRYSDVCVKSYDHACTGTSSVVAQQRLTMRGFTYFFLFVGLMSLFVIVRTIALLASSKTEEQLNLDTSFGKGRLVAVIISMLLSLVGICTLGLFAQYLADACRGRTMKDVHGKKRFVAEEDFDCSCEKCWKNLCSCDYPESEISKLTLEEIENFVL